MKRFEFVDITTSDVAFIAYGRDLGGLFANAALAMFDVMIDTGQVRHTIERKVSVGGTDMQSLLFNWLNGLLVYVDGENLAFSGFDVEVDEKRLTLKAVCKGEVMDRKRHETRTAVKSCTYHKMRIWKESGTWKAQAILDI